MAHAPVTASRLPCTWLPAVLISVVVSVLCALALYYVLAQHDRSLVTQRNTAAITAAGQRARAMAQTVAWFSESLVGENLATVQQTLEQHAQQADLLDAAVITQDNLIVAASDPAAIGKRLQDPGWLTARRSQVDSITAGVEKGRPALIVIEPLRQQGHIAGWIRLAIATPPDAAAPRSEDDLGRDVALAIGPLLLLMATLLILTMRGIMGQVRSLIVGILLEARDQAHAQAGRVAEMPDRG